MFPECPKQQFLGEEVPLASWWGVRGVSLEESRECLHLKTHKKSRLLFISLFSPRLAPSVRLISQVSRTGGLKVSRSSRRPSSRHVFLMCWYGSVFISFYSFWFLLSFVGRSWCSPWFNSTELDQPIPGLSASVDHVRPDKRRRPQTVGSKTEKDRTSQTGKAGSIERSCHQGKYTPSYILLRTHTWNQTRWRPMVMLTSNQDEGCFWRFMPTEYICIMTVMIARCHFVYSVLVSMMSFCPAIVLLRRRENECRTRDEFPGYRWEAKVHTQYSRPRSNHRYPKSNNTPCSATFRS